MTDKIDEKPILATISMCRDIMNNMGVALFKDDEYNFRMIAFIRNVCINLLGNFVMEYAVPEQKQQVIDETLSGLRDFFTHAKEIKANRETH